MHFKDYVSYRENHVEEGGNGDLDKLNKLILMIVRNPETFHAFLPQLQQIASLDQSGQINDELQTLDWNKIKKAVPHPDEPSGQPKEKEMDTVKPHLADMGKSELT